MHHELFKLGISCWLRGLMFYALFTLPALFFVPMYLISLFLALIGSFLPGVIFALILSRIKIVRYPSGIMKILLYALLWTFVSTCIATLIITSGNDMVSAYLEFILFPLAAMASCAMSIWTYRTKFVAGSQAGEPLESI